MDDVKKILDGVLRKFVCDDGGIYQGQCPQLPKYLLKKCGGSWTGRTNNGNKLVDRVVELGGYYGEGKTGNYRICSCDVNGSQYGHTWVEIKVNGSWVVYEQNIKRDGVQGIDFGCGYLVYPVTTTTARGNWRKNVRYAGHPKIDEYITKHTPKDNDIKVGSKVTLKDYKTIDGKRLAKTRDFYFVSEISGNRVVLRADSLHGVVYAAVALGNLRLYGEVKDVITFKVGDTVVPTRLVSYSGTQLWQYDTKYTITSLTGDRAVLSARGKIWAAMNIKDIKKA